MATSELFSSAPLSEAFLVSLTMEHFLGFLDGRAWLVFQPYMHRPFWIASFPEPLPLLPHCLGGSPGTSASLVWTTVLSKSLQAILATYETCLGLA